MSAIDDTALRNAGSIVTSSTRAPSMKTLRPSRREATCWLPVLSMATPFDVGGQRMIAAAIENKRVFFHCRGREALHFADENHVVAAVVLGVRLALKVRENAGKNRRVGVSGRVRD